MELSNEAKDALFADLYIMASEINFFVDEVLEYGDAKEFFNDYELDENTPKTKVAEILMRGDLYDIFDCLEEESGAGVCDYFSNLNQFFRNTGRNCGCITAQDWIQECEDNFNDPWSRVFADLRCIVFSAIPEFANKYADKIISSCDLLSDYYARLEQDKKDIAAGQRPDSVIADAYDYGF